MKRITLLLSIFISCASMCSIAQNGKYVTTMKGLITQLDTTHKKEDFQAAVNNFERIANAEKTQWLPYYYAAYALVMQVYSGVDKNDIDALMDKADALLTTAESLSKDNSEITTMQAMATQCRMIVDWSRGMTLGPKCGQIIAKAEKQLPADNPRVYMFQAQSLYNTPEAFGGSKTKAKELMKKSLDAYNSFKPESELHPNWGKEYVEKTLTVWNKQ